MINTIISLALYYILLLVPLSVHFTTTALLTNDNKIRKNIHFTVKYIILTLIILGGGVEPYNAKNSERCLCSHHTNTNLVKQYPCLILSKAKLATYFFYQ